MIIEAVFQQSWYDYNHPTLYVFQAKNPVHILIMKKKTVLMIIRSKVVAINNEI